VFLLIGVAARHIHVPGATARALPRGLLNDHINHCVTAAARGSQAGADAQLAATIRQVVPA
jgi:hypothetical protein